MSDPRESSEFAVLSEAELCAIAGGGTRWAVKAPVEVELIDAIARAGVGTRSVYENPDVPEDIVVVEAGGGGGGGVS